MAFIYIIFTLVVLLYFPKEQDALGISSKIVGGTHADDKEFPYQVALVRNSGSLICGGSIIHPNWILTAGHCLTENSIDEVVILVGTNSLDSGGTKYKPQKYFMHQNIELQDIGLIKLADNLQFDDAVQSISLSNEKTNPGTKVIFSGWGRVDLNGPDSNRLKKLNTVTTNATFCSQKLAEHPSHQQLQCDNICTLNKVGEGVCKGDSGGPLVDIATKKQVGIASFAYKCASGEPDVYVSVAKSYSWILQTTNSN